MTKNNPGAPLVCAKCGDTFFHYTLRLAHMKTAHGRKSA